MDLETNAATQHPPIDLGSTGFLINRASRRIHDDLEVALQPFGIRLRDYRVLQLIAYFGPQSQQRIGARLGIDRTTMVAIINGLENRQLVQRVRDESDRRKYAVSLTDGGRALLQGDMADTDRKVTEKVFVALGPAERHQLTALLWQAFSTQQHS